jgi:3-hydroxyisobutyrate dehydrogenase-like beta-hydroxyacid dehydrogenase
MRGEENETMPSVGVIGLGALGRPVAEQLLAHGFAVNVYDVRAEPVAALSASGASACTSPADVAARSDFIVSLVADESQTNEIVYGSGGMLEAVRPGTTVIIGSTLDPAVVRRIAGMLAARGAEVLDAPISGGLVAAREGTLSLMIGGDQQTLDRSLPVLRAFARAITHAGGIGAGQTAKLAHQLVFSINVMGLLEGLALGVAGGVDPLVLKTILKEGIANSSVLQLWDELGPRWKGMLRPSEPGAMPPNMRKDLHLALQLAHRLDVNLYVGTQASLIADAGVATGHADHRL